MPETQAGPPERGEEQYLEMESEEHIQERRESCSRKSELFCWSTVTGVHPVEGAI